MEKILLITGICCIIFTLIPFLPSDQWYIRFFDFPQLQLFWLTVIALTGNLFVSRANHSLIWLCILIAACLVYQLSIIIPYTQLKSPIVLQSTDGDPKSSISLLSSNVYMKNRDTSLLIREIKFYQPDVIVLIETDNWWKENMKSVTKSYPYQVECPLDNTYGMLVYSKLKLIDSEIKFLIEEDVPSIHTKAVLKSGQQVQLYLVHPTPPSPTENSQSTERDGELMLIGKLSKDNPLPVIVFGDLNDVAWSATTRLFIQTSGLLDPRMGRGLFNTFHAKIPFLRWPLDHIFHSNDFKLVSLERLPYIKSDHFPVYVELSYEPIAKKQKKESQASAKEQEKADEMIQEAVEQ